MTRGPALLDALAGDILIVVAPGAAVADTRRMAYCKLRPCIRLAPLRLEFVPPV